MRRFKKKLGNILLLSCLLFSTGVTTMVSTPHVVYADNIDRKSEVQPPNKVNDVEISEKPETLRGAIADAVYSKDVGGE